MSGDFVFFTCLWCENSYSHPGVLTEFSLKYSICRNFQFAEILTLTHDIDDNDVRDFKSFDLFFAIEIVLEIKKVVDYRHIFMK